MLQSQKAVTSCWRLVLRAASSEGIWQRQFEPCDSLRCQVPALQPAAGSAPARFSSSSSGVIRHTVAVADGLLEFEVGRMAALADGSCLVRQGGMQVLATAVCNWSAPPAQDFLPLQVDFREGAYASGRIPQTPSRREGGLSEREVLAARAVDRALRPLFPPGFLQEMHVAALLLAAEHPGQDGEVLAINAASAALMVSDIPWGGPVGAVRVAQAQGQLVVNPGRAQLAQADMSLTYAGTENLTVMLECSANQVPENVLAAAMQLGQQHIVGLVQAQRQLAQHAGTYKRAVKLLGADPELLEAITSVAGPLVRAALAQRGGDKAGRAAALERAKAEAAEQLRSQWLVKDSAEPGGMSDAMLAVTLDEVISSEMRRMVLGGELRVDGRRRDEIRRLSCELGVLPPAVHGSALFQRGETQSLCTATVGSDRDAQQGSSVREAKAFMLHYTFPPFSTGEVGKLGGQPSRREVGHGALAEKSLAPVMPKAEDFPFTVRATAETLMSNGSSSMAATCGSCLALHNAGVPLQATVAGISVGLLTERPPRVLAASLERTPAHQPYPWQDGYGEHALLTDIQGLEDHLGDMDFKVSGTATGVTAIQLDTKLPGLPVEWLQQALVVARTGRLQVLEVMEAAMAQAKQSKEEQPHFSTTEINKELLGRLVGINGSKLMQIEEDSGAKLIVNDTGEVDIYAPTLSQWRAAEFAIREVEGATIRDGEVYDVKVVKVEDSGAYVQLPSELQAFLHLSEISHTKVRDINDVLTEGMQFKVKCIGRDSKGMIQLSKKALEPNRTAKVGEEPPAIGRARHTPSAHTAKATEPPGKGGEGKGGEAGQSQMGATTSLGSQQAPSPASQQPPSQASHPSAAAGRHTDGGGTAAGPHGDERPAVRPYFIVEEPRKAPPGARRFTPHRKRPVVGSNGDKESKPAGRSASPGFARLPPASQNEADTRDNSGSRDQDDKAGRRAEAGVVNRKFRSMVMPPPPGDRKEEGESKA